MTRSIAVLVGSLRKDSFTRKVANAIAELTPGLAFSQVEIGNLSLYNQDDDTAAPPATWTVLRDTLRAADGYLHGAQMWVEFAARKVHMIALR